MTDHNNMKASIQAITVEHGELNRSLYKGQPFVYTGICISFSVVEINRFIGITKIYHVKYMETFLQRNFIWKSIVY